MKTTRMIVIKCIHAVVKYNKRPLFYIRIYLLYYCIIILLLYIATELLNFGTNVSVSGLARNGVYGFWQKGKREKKLTDFVYIYIMYILYIHT